MNVRLVRASQFLSQFDLDVRHKPGKDHIIPDALSRLASMNRSQLPDHYSELDVLFTSILVEIDDSFRKKLVDRYEDDAW